jgi:hypothetical protein
VAKDDKVVEEEQLEAEEQELVALVPEQGEDEGDYEDDGTRFTASIASKDWTVETLVSQMRKDRIDLSPSFQRRNAWLGNRKSKLIESILLGFPIPQIVLAERRDLAGHYFVLDGKQRLLALRQFFADSDDPRDKGFLPLRLSSLEVLADLNRSDRQKLEKNSPELAARLENHTIRTVVLSDWNSERMLLSLFLRLNTGSVQLSPQELRQALIPGAFIQWLDKVSGELPPLMRLLGNKHPDRRMVDAELTLRHLAFARSSSEYRGNLKQFLDDTSRAFNDGWDRLEDQIIDELIAFGAALSSAQDSFGDSQACRKWSGTKFERALNRAIFDVQIYSLSFPEVRRALEGNEEHVIELFKHACVTNEAFSRAISATTKTADAFITRHRQWARIMREACSVEYPLPAPLRRD